MKVKIKARRYLGFRGEKMVRLEVVEVDDPKFTSKVFVVRDKFVLRKVENGVLEEIEDKYYGVDVEVRDESEIEKMVEQIRDLYRQVIEGKKGWAGEKEYELEI